MKLKHITLQLAQFKTKLSVTSHEAAEKTADWAKLCIKIIHTNILNGKQEELGEKKNI